MVEIMPGLSVPEEEIAFATSRSPGPGGQHVNTTDTRVTLRFDVVNSKSLSQAQKRRIMERLATRISAAGVLRVVSHAARSQWANKQAALERFALLLRRALTPPKPRRATAVPRGEKARRLTEKRRRGETKKARTRPGGDEA